MSALIEVHRLEKDFRRGKGIVRAVAGVDLSLEEGEAVGVIGESGSGKSTLARCITRLETPTSGQVVFDGDDVTKLKDRALRSFRRRVQPVFQDPLAALNPRWNVRSLVSEPLKLHGVEDVEGRVNEVLGEVGLRTELLRRRPADLSGGERQRVAIGRAIALRPAVLVLDEPTASVDMSMRRSLLALLRRLQEEQRLTYLYISHDIRTVEETCNRTVVMYRGRLVEEGPTDQVLGSPADSYTRLLMAAVPRLGRAQLGTGRATGDLSPGGGDA